VSPKPPRHVSEEALFRYQIISAVLAQERLGARRAEVIRDLATARHPVPGGERTVSARSIYRWLAAYNAGGLEGLEPADREKLKGSLVLSNEFLEFLIQGRERDPNASIPELIRQARACGVLHSLDPVVRSTVWRTCRRMEIATRRRRSLLPADVRRFAFPERMQLGLGDFVHFRAGSRRLRRVALYLLDDATRFGLGVRVGTSERAELLLLELEQAVRTFGRMDALYFDRGSAFWADDVKAALASLEIPAIPGTAGYPQGRGKVERFFRSLRARLLRSLDGAADVDPDPGALRLRLAHDLFEIYNHLPHEGLGGDTPHQRFYASNRPLVPFDDEERLRSAFILPVTRSVSNDGVVSYDGTAYELPRGVRGRTVTIYRYLLEGGAIYMDHEGRRIRLHPVDPAANATSGRGSRSSKTSEEPGAPPPSASKLAFGTTFLPMCDEDGGYSAPSETMDDTPIDDNTENKE